MTKLRPNVEKILWFETCYQVVYGIKNQIVAELDDENWLTDLAFLEDLTAHLNEVNMHLQGENLLISIMFQTISVFQMKLKLRQTQIKANNFMLFDTLAKHNSVNSEKYAVLVFQFETRTWKHFKIFEKIINIFL